MTVTCPRPCGSEGFANPAALAAHLIDAHDMAGSAALAKARDIIGLPARSLADAIAVEFPSKPIRPKPILPKVSTAKETAMTCKKCGKPGHRKDSPEFHPKDGANGEGRDSVASKPRAATKRKPITRRHPQPPKKATATSRNGLLSELDALRSTAAALEPLGPVERMHVLACVCKLLAIETSELVA